MPGAGRHRFTIDRDVLLAGLVAGLALLAFGAGLDDGKRRAADAGAARAGAAALPRPGLTRIETRAAGSDGPAAPSQFGWRAWRAILARTYEETLEDDLTTIAGGIAFYGLLSLFPAIAALVSVYALVADPATIRDHLNELAFLLPPDTFSIVEDQVSRVIAQGNGALGVKLLVSLAFSMWSATAGMKALLASLNVAYEERETRSFLRLSATAMLLTLAALFLVLLILALAAVLPEIFDAHARSGAMTIALNILRWPAALILLSVGLSALYRYGPSRAEPQWRWVTWGGTLAAILILAISVILGWYLTNLADYNKTYGSLGAAIGLMTWIWLSSTAILVGAELNAEMERQSAMAQAGGGREP